MEPKCDRCQEFYDQGAKFCGNCGHSFPRIKGELSLLEKLMIVLSTFACIFIILEMLILLLVSPGVFSIAGNMGIDITVITPTPTTVFKINGLGAELWWTMLVCVLTAVVCYSVWKYFKGMKILKNDKEPENVMRTGLFWVAVLFSANIALELPLMFGSMALGTPIDGSWMGEYTNTELLLLLAQASFWEEIISRVMFIGIPIFVLQLIKTRKINSTRYIIGGFGMSKAAIVLIVFSGIMFGMAHNSGWGIGKALITSIGGIIMGYIFVRFGLYASILMHFLTDYMSSFMYCGFELSFISVIGIVVFIVMGVIAILYILNKMPREKNGLIKMLKAYPTLGDRRSK